MCAHAEFITFGRTGGIGCVPMQNLLLLADLNALGVSPCRIHYFWQNWGHWACAHAQFITFGRTGGIGRVPMRNSLLLATGGIGCVPMQNLLLLAGMKALGVSPCGVYYFWQTWGHWACAHAESITFGRTEGIGRVPMQNLLLLAELKAWGACPCKTYYFWQK